jgi:hypothetical protein
MSHLQPAIHLAKKMGKKLGQYHLLQRKMPPQQINHIK